MREPFRSLVVAIVVLLFVVIGSSAAARGAAGRRSPSFGQFAGYAWAGPVTTVQASWTVPRIDGGSTGVAGMWIGAQGPGAARPFIQIGTNEASLRPFAHGPRITIYRAFWSDTTHHFHAVRLFGVRPGDRISASLALANGQWTLAILDASSGASVRFSTPEEALAAFNYAEWLQEDPRDGATGRPAPYPRLSAIRFRELAVNSVVPSYPDLYSQWMTVNGANLAPSPLRQGSFFLHPATVDSAGATYLRIAATDDAATKAYLAQTAAWTTATPAAEIESSSSLFATALRNNIKQLAHTRWPTEAQRAILSLIQSNTILLDHTESAPTALSVGLTAWLTTWANDASSVGTSAHEVRHALGVPELTPTQ